MANFSEPRSSCMQERLLCRTIKELGQKTKETTTRNIAEAYERALGKPVKPDELVAKLNNLEGHGIIKRRCHKHLEPVNVDLEALICEK